MTTVQTQSIEVLATRGVGKSYGTVQALRDVHVSIRAGEILALLGPNGAGKTTFVSIVAGLSKPDAGQVSVCGDDAIGDRRRLRAMIGLAPQELGIYLGATVAENLRFFAELSGIRGSQLDDRVGEVAAAVQLGDLLDRRARFLSGGEKRRLHTAAALLHKPPLLLLDEPTVGVDVATRSMLLQYVRTLAAEGTAICYSTHYLQEVEDLGASVAILDQGSIIAQGSVPQLIRLHGTSTVDLTLDAAASVPEITAGLRVEYRDKLVRVYSDEPTADASAVLEQLRATGVSVRSLEILTPSLESVFLSLTGRRYSSDERGER